MFQGRIYPIPLKPASPIRRWEDWPDDVREILRWWNKKHRGLSFGGYGVFKCSDCEAFCEPQKYGTATIAGVPLCDDCLIERARRALKKRETIELGRPEGCGSCICRATPKPEGGYEWHIRPECSYHAVAAAHPRNHSIPWNCPTYWDGCNCDLPQHNGPKLESLGSNG